MATLRTAAAALLLLAPQAIAQDDVPAAVNKQWMVRVARMEGASVDVEEAAAEVNKTAQSIAAAGRLHSIAELVSDVNKLNKKVVSARLAAQVLDE